MPAIDLQTLTASVSDADPGGPDLEYDAAFIALEEAARSEPEQQFGNTLVAASEPNWPEVRKLSIDVLKRSKDLRAALYLLQAVVHLDGLPGMTQGLALMRALLETFWDNLHPRLDPDDDLDPTARVNIVSSMCDPMLVLRALRLAPMVRIPGLGGITLRDVQIAQGRAPAPEGEEFLKLDSIEAAIRDLDLEVIQSALTDVKSAIDDVVAIEQTLLEKVGVTHAVGLDPLTQSLREIANFLTEQLAARGALDEGVVSETATDDDSGTRTGAGGAQRQRISGEITCSQDVINALDQIIAYYRAHEPSSPIPLLLQRARRLVPLGFMDVLRDIAPDALSQAQLVTGANDEA